MSIFHDIGFDELEVMFNEVKKYIIIYVFFTWLLQKIARNIGRKSFL